MADNKSGWDFPVDFYFQIEFQNLNEKGFKASFQEVEGLGFSIEYKNVNNNSNDFVKIPTVSKCGSLTLKRPLTPLSEDLNNWIHKTKSMLTLPRSEIIGKSWTCDIVVKLLDIDGSPLAAWSLERAVPTSYTLGTLNSSGNGLAMETIVLDYSNIERVV